MNLFKAKAPAPWYWIGMTIGLCIWFVVRDSWLPELANPWYVRYGVSGLVGCLLAFAIELSYKVWTKKSESSQ